MESTLLVSSQFSLQEAILETMVYQARRSVRSLSESSCSSLSSIGASSICSVSSLTSLSSSGEGHTKDFELDVEGEFRPTPSSRMDNLQDEVRSTLGKRRRKRNSEKEGSRRAKRRKANPRKRGRSRKERIDRSKKRQAVKKAVKSDVPLNSLCRSLTVEKTSEVFDIEAVKSKGVTVVSWDGV